MNMRASWIVTGVTLAGCTISRQAVAPQTSPASGEASLASPNSWQAFLPPGGGGHIAFTSASPGFNLTISSVEAQQARAVARVDASHLRGKRVTVRAGVQMPPHDSNAFAVMHISLERASVRADPWDSSSSSRNTIDPSKVLQAVLDVTDDTTALRIELIVEGTATAVFEAPRFDVASRPVGQSLGLSQTENDRLQTLARLTSYIRFFHPSDQSATVDWPAFEVEAVHRILAAISPSEAKAVLDWVTHTTAPTAVIYQTALPPPAVVLPRENGTRLTRWVRIGFRGDPYVGFRTGLNEPASVGVVLSKTVPSQGCKHAKVRSSASVVSGSPMIELYLAPRRGASVPSMTSKIVAPDATIEGDVPADAGAITFGIRVGGEGAVKLVGLDLSCGGTSLATLTSVDEIEPIGLGYHLYSVSKSRCDKQTCIMISRDSELDDSSTRNVLDVDIGLGLRFRMPLAVWADSTRTYPRMDKPISFADSPSPADRASRLAAVLDIWSILKWFYPYFDDIKVNWDNVLPGALDAAAQAATADDLLGALARMLAELRDGHASIARGTFDNGVLPLSFRLIDGTLYVKNGIGAYGSIVPKGSVVETINREPINLALNRAAMRLSAATSAWRDAYLPVLIGHGPEGMFVQLKMKSPDGNVRQVAVPRMERSKYLWQVREARPTTGTELSPGIYYVDLTKLDPAAWEALVPRVATARGLVVDNRGQANDVAFHVLAHLSNREMKSPYWDTPIVDVHPTKRYERLQWTITPETPRFGAKIVFLIDGRTISTSETVMQIARSYHLGMTVGEPTGGTNGDVTSFQTLGGLRVRFTGLRTLNSDGTAFHGTGIVPDIMVHPTPAGIVSGKDEVLEAAIRQF